MKYMGSKRAMLRNGLGKLIDAEIGGFGRFVDLFAGSGAVAAHVASRYSVPVSAYDIQAYSVAVTSALVSRSYVLDGGPIWESWLARASTYYAGMSQPLHVVDGREDVLSVRDWCSEQLYPITRAYGGYYFSPSQALWFDAFRSTVPAPQEESCAAIAALVEAASHCVAAPGHTAQPFQPTPTAWKFLLEAWNRDPITYIRRSFLELCSVKANVAGMATIRDANDAASDLMPDDLVFIDPPYSGGHYSRFYHVLETVALGECGEVTGVGRYPDPSRRPKSRYSLKGQSVSALVDLLSSIAQAGATGILTFPDHACSNGLSGEQVRELSRKHFVVDDLYVNSVFSTLGGHSLQREADKSRQARQTASEMMLVLRPTGSR
ncbi:adenine methyltransferase [Rhizobium laguerreae]|uniref:DNA adenine methylase n=1 Tax=Rhizobium laguerreae TaxID=1076926 RepID=UPI001C91373F|nr:DNA adenine methylase [Rhizobium laguerreae]MBY3144866.1 adenine methyltransferase [Rhizobium laguerreae]